MTAQHTPEPWLAGEPEDGDEWWFGSGLEISVRSASGQTICVYGANSPEEIANARLIAAAPDLLAALETVLHICCIEHARPIAEEAVRKARGE